MTSLEVATPRLLLRDFTPQDEAAFVAYHDDATEAAALLRTFAGWRSADPRINVQLAACRRDAVSTLIGCCGLRREGFPPGIAEFGIELAPAWWGRYRYAVEIAEAMVAYGFDRLGLGEIVGRTTAGNRKVHRLAAWFGATTTSPDAVAVEWRITRAVWRRGPGSPKERSVPAGPGSRSG